MTWYDDLLDQLAAELPCAYRAEGPAATEPTALAALALLGAGRIKAAERGLVWLTDRQSDDGSLGAVAGQTEPKWPTSLAVLAWQLAADRGPHEFRTRFNHHAERAIEWIISTRGHTMDRDDTMGHDTTIAGWPWADATHSWIEPTCFHVLALKASGRTNHPRTLDGIRLIHDRLLSTGGCNYGNTTVLGQELRPHIQPTGLAMIALVGQPDPDGRIARSLEFLQQQLPRATGTASLCWGLLGLAGHNLQPRPFSNWLEQAYQRTIARGAAPLRLALLALALQGRDCPFIQITSELARS